MGGGRNRPGRLPDRRHQRDGLHDAAGGGRTAGQSEYWLSLLAHQKKYFASFSKSVCSFESYFSNYRLCLRMYSQALLSCYKVLGQGKWIIGVGVGERDFGERGMAG